MKNDIYTLEERDGSLYAKQTFTDDNLPRIIANWYLLTTPLDQFRTWFASTERMKASLGGVLEPTINPATVWKDERGWTYHIISGISGERKAVFTEITPIPEPVQRGRKYPLEWHKCAWHKRTGKGLVKLQESSTEQKQKEK